MTNTSAFREWLLERTGNHAKDIGEANRFADEIEQLRGNLSLAEDGLANYALEVERLTRDMAALQSQWDDMQQGFVEVFGEPVRDAIELLGATERLRSAHEPATLATNAINELGQNNEGQQASHSDEPGACTCKGCPVHGIPKHMTTAESNDGCKCVIDGNFVDGSKCPIHGIPVVR